MRIVTSGHSRTQGFIPHIQNLYKAKPDKFQQGEGSGRTSPSHTVELMATITCGEKKDSLLYEGSP